VIKKSFKNDRVLNKNDNDKKKIIERNDFISQ
jgi:hypothetical protein